MLKKLALAVVGLATILSVATPANARTVHRATHRVVAHKAAAVVNGQECPGGVPAVYQGNALEMAQWLPFDPTTGGYYVNLAKNVTYCIPAGWQVLSENALPGNPTYAVRVGDIPWVSFTYDANGSSTPHARPSWVLL